MRIYITHCSAKKNAVLKNSGKKVSPDKLYIATPTQRFMNKCIEKRAIWAIFSDLYGVWFPNVEHEWYEKDPNSVTEQEFKYLLQNFEQSLQNYNKIWFYYNSGRFHPLYGQLLRETKLKDKVNLFTHLREIV